MAVTQRPGQLLVLLPILACLLPHPGQAKDGRDDDNSDDSHAVAAAGCTELATVAGAPSARSGGAFTVRDGAVASLVCALPTDELDRSADDRARPVGLEIAYRDSDGPGLASVTVELNRTMLAADQPDGFADAVVCAWSSADGGPVVGTTASVTCPTGIVEGGFYHLRVGLTSVPGSAASFVGVVARR